MTNVHGRAIDLLRAESSRRTRETRRANLSVAPDYDLEREALGSSPSPNRSARRSRPSPTMNDARDRARLLRWPQLPPGCCAPRGARRYGQEQDPRRFPPPARHTRRHRDRGIMGRELTPAELDELLPLYALGALDTDELEQVEHYVRRSAVARDEVDVAARGGKPPPQSAGRARPPRLWTRIEGMLTEPPPNTLIAPAPAPSRPRQLPSRSTRPRRVLLASAALVACIAIGISVFLGVKVSDQQSRIDQLAALMHHDTMANQAEAAKAVRGADLVMLTSADATHTAQVVVLPDGTGYLMHPELPTTRRRPHVPTLGEDRHPRRADDDLRRRARPRTVRDRIPAWPRPRSASKSPKKSQPAPRHLPRPQWSQATWPELRTKSLPAEEPRRPG